MCYNNAYSLAFGVFVLVLGIFCAVLVVMTRKGDGIVATAIFALLLIASGWYAVADYFALGRC